MIFYSIEVKRVFKFDETSRFFLILGDAIRHTIPFEDPTEFPRSDIKSIGNLTKRPRIGDLLFVSAELTTHPTFGRQLRCSNAEYADANAVISREILLGGIPFIGGGLAKSVVNNFGDRLVDAAGDRSALTGLANIGKQKAGLIHDYVNRRAIKLGAIS